MEELAIPGASQSGLRPNMSSSARKRPGHRLRLFLARGRHDNFTRDAHVRLLPPRAESLSEFDSEMQWFESCRPNRPVSLERIRNRVALEMPRNGAPWRSLPPFAMDVKRVTGDGSAGGESEKWRPDWLAGAAGFEPLHLEIRSA